VLISLYRQFILGLFVQRQKKNSQSDSDYSSFNELLTVKYAEKSMKFQKVSVYLQPIEKDGEGAGCSLLFICIIHV
jgi:hypothetical protein